MLASRARNTTPLLAALLIFLAGITPTAHAEKPALTLLQYNSGAKIKSTPIPDVPGKFKSPVAGKPQASWVLARGDLRSSATSPPERAIRFYRYVNAQPELVCTVQVKYFPHNGQWEPAYRMEDRVVLMRDGANVKPIPSGTGDMELVLMLGSSLPNVDGYYSKLEFGLPSKSVTIDAWDIN
jgi:hypothetical protein